MFIRVISTAIVSFFLSVCFAETSLELPAELPELNVTAAGVLGSNEEGIGLKVGDRVANFSVQTHDGQPASMEGLLKANSTLLVIFYRGGWCPYCNRQIRELTEAWPEFEQRKITPVLISVDKTDGASLAQRTYEIPFPVLSDPELKAHRAFDVTFDVDDAMYERYKGYGLDLEQWSGQGHHKIAVAAAFFVNKKGVVTWAHTTKDYKTRPSAQQLLTVAEGL